jgi:hypothetical protein
MINATNSGVTILKIKGSKVIQDEDFLETSDGDDYKIILVFVIVY